MEFCDIFDETNLKKKLFETQLIKLNENGENKEIKDNKDKKEYKDKKDKIEKKEKNEEKKVKKFIGKKMKRTSKKKK